MKASEAKKISIESQLMSIYYEIRMMSVLGKMECEISIRKKTEPELYVIIEELRTNGYVVNQITDNCLKISW